MRVPLVIWTMLARTVTVVALGVDVAAAQRGEFAVAQARERGQKDESAKARRDAAREVEDLGDGGDRSLGRVVFAGSLDAAGVAPDEFVVDGGVQHRVQSRYAFAIIVAVEPAATSSACQARTRPGVMSLSWMSPKVGSR